MENNFTCPTPETAKILYGGLLNKTWCRQMGSSLWQARIRRLEPNRSALAREGRGPVAKVRQGEVGNSAALPYRPALAAVRTGADSIRIQQGHLAWKDRFLLFHKLVEPNSSNDSDISPFLEKRQSTEMSPPMPNPGR